MWKHYIHGRAQSQTTPMILSFHPCFDADVQVVLGNRSIDGHDLDLIGRAESIILPQTCSRELYEACSKSGANLFPNYALRFKYPGKIGQIDLFKKLHCPFPETLCWSGVEDFKRTHGRGDPFPHRPPFLIKENNAHEGTGIHFVEDRSALSIALNELAVKETEGESGFITQAFVSTGGNALRAVIIGKRIN
ncbi:MAG: hypothetical protein JSU59_04945, partial [Nitrospirota bacterium]